MREQIEILSVPVDVVTMNQAVGQVLSMTKEPGFHMVATANAEMIMMAMSHAGLKDILCTAELVIPDGAGALWAAEQQGRSFPERVAGVDLTEELMAMAAREQLPVYFVGAAPGVVDKAVDALRSRYPQLIVAGYHSGFFDDEEERTLVRDIEESGAKIVLAALGVPKQELWLCQKLSHLDGVVGMGVGGTFDVLAGHVTRAPKWMQKNRLEWLYRLYKQPSRFTRMLALPRFMLAVKRHGK